MVQYAAMAVNPGLANVVCCVFADDPLNEGQRAVAAYAGGRPMSALAACGGCTAGLVVGREVEVAFEALADGSGTVPVFKLVQEGAAGTVDTFGSAVTSPRCARRRCRTGCAGIDAV